MKRKAWLLLLVPVLLILLWVFILQPLHRTSRLLKQADVPISAIRSVIDQDYWYDWLEYTDGYDWAILRVDPDAFTPPAKLEHHARPPCRHQAPGRRPLPLLPLGFPGSSFPAGRLYSLGFHPC